MRIRWHLRSSLALIAIALSDSVAFAGPGACVQTLLQIQEAAHGKWLKGILPSRVPGVRGKNDVVLFALKDGSHVLNEGANFYVLPLEKLTFGKGKLLTNRRGNNLDGNYGLADAEVARLVTPQGNEVRLHRLRMEQASALVLRGDSDDQARLKSASESLAMKQHSLENLIKDRRAKHAEICAEINSSSQPSLAKLAGAVITPLNAITGSGDLQAQKLGTEKDIKDFRESQVERQKEHAAVQELAKQAQSMTPPTTKIDEPPVLPKVAETILAEVTEQFLERMKETFISPTDRKEIHTYCGDSVKLPESTGTDAERNVTCDQLQGPQKQICVALSNPTL